MAHQAGAVRSRSDQRKATSDWMELEKQRGISITSTVLSFEYNGNHINLLDTPGHQVRRGGSVEIQYCCKSLFW